MVLAPPNLVCESMSMIGIWELRATPSWREPPSKSLIPWYWLELGAACYAFVQEPPPESQFYWGMGATCYTFVRKSPPESLSLYISPVGAHHSSYKPLGRVYGDYGLWGRLLVCLIYGFSLVSLRMKIIHESEGSLKYEIWIYVYESLIYDFTDIVYLW